ncbi:hypothetical protein ABIE51_001423 [Lysobacter sp. OAE881]|uniref:hypothetical protein n=1 Tax=Lysobacter sp. OAE881 TaxID=2663813 RepID=UPI0017892EF8
MSPTHESPARREARCRVQSLLLNATPEQQDHMRGDQSWPSFLDWMLRLSRKCPFTALAYIGA